MLVRRDKRLINQVSDKHYAFSLFLTTWGNQKSLFLLKKDKLKQSSKGILQEIVEKK